MTKAKSPPKSSMISKGKNLSKMSGSSIPSPIVEHSSKADTSSQEAFFECMDKVVAKAGAKGVTLIIGRETDRTDDDEEDTATVKVDKPLSSRELSKLRYVVVTENREKMMKLGVKLATAGQQNSNCMMFDTQTGNDIIFQIPDKIRAAMKKKNLPARFDALYGLTHGLYKYDIWLDDNEMGGEGGELEAAINLLATSWRTLLSKSDAELGIDSEFTRPGVKALLRQCAERFAQACDGYDFEWCEDSSDTSEGEEDEEEADVAENQK